jgi:polysaccharide export outer membrane protein
MTAESAVAIAGGYSPRARRDVITVTHPAAGGSLDSVVTPNTPISPGDTVVVGERWF